MITDRKFEEVYANMMNKSNVIKEEVEIIKEVVDEEVEEVEEDKE